MGHCLNSVLGWERSKAAGLGHGYCNGTPSGRLVDPSRKTKKLRQHQQKRARTYGRTTANPSGHITIACSVCCLARSVLLLLSLDVAACRASAADERSSSSEHPSHIWFALPEQRLGRQRLGRRSHHRWPPPQVQLTLCVEAERRTTKHSLAQHSWKVGAHLPAHPPARPLSFQSLGYPSGQRSARSGQVGEQKNTNQAFEAEDYSAFLFDGPSCIPKVGPKLPAELAGLG